MFPSRKANQEWILFHSSAPLFFCCSCRFCCSQCGGSGSGLPKKAKTKCFVCIFKKEHVYKPRSSLSRGRRHMFVCLKSFRSFILDNVRNDVWFAKFWVGLFVARGFRGLPFIIKISKLVFPTFLEQEKKFLCSLSFLLLVFVVSLRWDWIILSFIFHVTLAAMVAVAEKSFQVPFPGTESDWYLALVQSNMHKQVPVSCCVRWYLGKSALHFDSCTNSFYFGCVKKWKTISVQVSTFPFSAFIPWLILERRCL